MGTRRPVAPAEKGAQAPHRPPAVQAPESLTSERFPRRTRLARGADLKACWDLGRRRHLTHLDLAWRPSEAGHARLGVIVPRFHHTAVARNRLRRRLREIVRRGLLAQLPAVDIVVRARRSAYDAPVAALRAELTEGVSRMT